MKENKTSYLEAIRCVAICLVVMIHVVAIPIQNWNSNSMTWYPVYSIAYALGNCGVPLFLMISGTLLLNPQKEITFEKLYKKMMPRILAPLIVFGWMFALMELYFETHSFGFEMFGKALLRVINRNSWEHLWYLYMLIGIYVFLPVLKSMIEKISDELFKYLMGCLIIIGYVFPTINAVLKSNISVNAPLPLCHVTCFLMGYAVVKWENSIRFNRFVKCFGVISLVILLVANGVSGKISPETYGVLAQYNDIFVLGLTVYMYELIKRTYSNKNISGGYSLASCSFGVYLIHPVVMNVLYKVLKIMPTDYCGIISVPAFVVIFIIPAWLGTAIMRKIPIIKKLV